MDVGVPASPTPMQVTGVMPAAVGMTTTNLGFHAGALPTGEPAPASAKSYSLRRRGTQPAASGAAAQAGPAARIELNVNRNPALGFPIPACIDKFTDFKNYTWFEGPNIRQCRRSLS